MTHIEQRGKTAAQWATDNDILYECELGWEVDALPGPKAKMGDGVQHWNDLEYTASAVAWDAADFDLDLVDNTSDEDKPVSTATQAGLDLKADKNSPVFTGNPTAPTPLSTDDDTSLATTEWVRDAVASLLLAANPVGSIKMSAVNTNPSTYLGGTWVAWGSGRVPVGVDGAQTEFDTVEETGGEKTHTLTIGEIPSHDHVHTHTAYATVDADAGTNRRQPAPAPGGSNVATSANTAAPMGGGGPHNNLQPYITCYMFKRTA